MAAKAYSDDIRAQALADLVLGMSVSAIAAKYSVSRPTVRRWRAEQNGVPMAAGSPIVQQKRDLGELVARYLDTGLQALEAQARQFGDPAWLKRQDADKLAILHGVLADKLVRVLSALEPADGGDSD